MRILLVEDDENLCDIVSMCLQKQGYTVDVCHEGDDGLRWMLEQGHDAVLLDRMLPRLDGIAVLKAARARGVDTPVLMITALDALGQRVEGLDAGADDYITKPFELDELLARIRAISRRPRAWKSHTTLACGDLHYDPELKELVCGANNCVLSPREGSLMEALLRNKGQTLPRNVLLTRVWGPDAGIEEGNLDNYVRFLRRRLENIGSAVKITTVRGVGYRVSGND